MIVEILIAALWSISPFGEAKVGIPYAIFNNVNIYISFIVCFLSNVLIYPVMRFFLGYVNHHLLKWKFYRKLAVKVARRVKVGVGSKVTKFGFWGILIFVMLPIPGTGVYAGTIASYLFGMPYRRAFWANTIGIFLSCAIVWGMTLGTYYSIN